MYPQRTAREISEQVTNSGTVYIRLLGTDTRYWAIQKNLLRHHSSYFRARLSDDALDQTLDNLKALEATSHLVSAEPFELLVQWLYTGGIDPVAAPTASHPTAAQLDVYIRLHCLCSPAHLNIPLVQDLALTRMREVCLTHHASFSAQHVGYIYTHTPPASPLRKIALQAAAHDFMTNSPPTPIPTPSSDADDDSAAQPTGARSYEYMTSSVDFASDLLYLIRAHVGPTNALPHPFLASPPSPSPSPSPSPHLIPHPATPSTPTTPPLSSLSPPTTPTISPLAPAPSQLAVPVSNLLTPDATPKKGVSARERVRKRSEGELVKGIMGAVGEVDLGLGEGRETEGKGKGECEMERGVDEVGGGGVGEEEL